ncbi:hypothetical protein ABZ565_01535 [Streptomyces sp. NPDC016469]|uniref:hypothetical protein n=1 Tax=Streptomyces sp. NPDC016469 TaxID=3157191 RepID=UPI003405BEAD
MAFIVGLGPRMPPVVAGEQATGVAVVPGGSGRAVRENAQLDVGVVPPEPQGDDWTGLAKESVVRAVRVAGELALHGRIDASRSRDLARLVGEGKRQPTPERAPHHSAVRVGQAVQRGHMHGGNTSEPMGAIRSLSAVTSVLGPHDRPESRETRRVMTTCASLSFVKDSLPVVMIELLGDLVCPSWSTTENRAKSQVSTAPMRHS